MTWFDKNIYWETSAVNYMADQFEWNDAVATKGLQAVKRNRYYISPVTIWEILLTGDDSKKEQIIFYSQHLFHDKLINFPSEFILNFIRQGCPLYETKYDFHSKLPMAKTWENLCNDTRLTFIYEKDILKEKSKIIQDTSKQLNKIINRIVLDLDTDDLEYQYQQLLDRYHKRFRDIKRRTDKVAIKIQKITMLFMFFILCLEVELDNTAIREFWRQRSINGTFDRLDYLLHNYKILVHRGPFAEMALMAYTQISEGMKSNRGLFFDCLHCIYLPYIDFFVTRDDHFRKLRDNSDHILFTRIVHMDEIQVVTHKRKVVK